MQNAASKTHVNAKLLSLMSWSIPSVSVANITCFRNPRYRDDACVVVALYKVVCNSMILELRLNASAVYLGVTPHLGT